jgi:RimJ/RimL family protein N-acetyltransferase
VPSPTEPPLVTLVPLVGRDREAFVQEEVANYAEQQVRDAGWPRAEALDRARAMLAALEERLVRDGIDELLLHVNVGNQPARRLYAAAGYEQVGADRRVCRLRKSLE